jgi:hypothetical protein
MSLAETPEPEILPHEGFLEVRLFGAFTVPGFIRQLDLAVQACLKEKVNLLLLDYSELTGDVSTFDRFEIGSHGSKVGKDLAKMACLARPDQVAGKFGAVVARNRGLTVEVFTERSKALRWLLPKRQTR